MVDSQRAPTGRRRRSAWLVAVATALIAAGLFVTYVPGFSEARRAETADETVFYFFAQNLGEPILCDRISWSAHRTYNMMFAGGGASYFRSDCYEQVAEARHDPAICWKVRPLVDLDPASPGYSALACRRRTLASEHIGIGLPDEVLIRTFERVGFGADRMGKEPGTAPFIRWQDVYGKLERDPVAIARAQDLLTQAGGPSDAVDRSYIAHLAAIGTLDPKWCVYIPPGQALDQVAGPFRDWCYFTVAYDKNDIRVCDQMTPPLQEAKVQEAIAQGVRPEIAMQLALHTQCMRSGQSVGPRLRYAPQLPADETVAGRVFAALGVAMPSARDLPAPELARLYQNFLFTLMPSQPRSAEQEAARTRLVARLASM